MARASTPRAVWRWVVLTLSLLALVAGPAGPVETWECSMSGSRAGPCPCGAAHHDGDDDDAADAKLQRKSCCHRQPVAESSPVVDLAPKTRAPAPVAVASLPVLGAPLPAPVRLPPPRVRGPPPTGPPSYVANCSLLL